MLTFLVLALGVLSGGSQVLAAESINTPDTGLGSTAPIVVGGRASLALDSSGNPVMSYWDQLNGDLKVLHCDDINCAAGGDSVTSPDTGGTVGALNSLALDSAGNPVVSYSDQTNFDLKVLHCNDVDCAGGDESITSPDTGGAGSVGNHSSLALDSAGNPVVSYYDATNFDLKVLHCNDVNCAAGGDTINSPDTGGDVGTNTSVELDGSGNPVVSYNDVTNGDLKVLHCSDINCAAGGDSVTTPDAGGSVGAYTSLELDTVGNPVVSYYDVTNSDLKVLHCDDINCAAGGDSVTSPDTAGSPGTFTSLALDGSGNPVVSYSDTAGTPTNLKVLHCNDANCAAGGDSITTPDTAGINIWTSVALDSAGNPVVGYVDALPAGTSTIKVLHCNDANCSGTAKQLPINIANFGQYVLPKTCFEVRNPAQVPYFEVCDNDSTPESDPICLPDGICGDDNPAAGSVTIPVLPGDYRVVVSAAAPQHAADASIEVCTNAAPVGGENCSFTFTNTPNTRPWHPWDITGAVGGGANGQVRIDDIVAVLNHYFVDKPLP